MSSRMTLKSVSVDGLRPTITLTPVIESCDEGCRIHHIKSDSIAHGGRDTFVPLRHVSKQKRRIFELEEENDRLRELVKNLHACNGSCPRCIELMGRCEYEEQLGELGIEVEDV